MPTGPPIVPGLFAAMGFMAVIAILIALVIAGFFLMLGAKFAGIEGANLGEIHDSSSWRGNFGPAYRMDTNYRMDFGNHSLHLGYKNSI